MLSKRALKSLPFLRRSSSLCLSLGLLLGVGSTGCDQLLEKGEKRAEEEEEKKKQGEREEQDADGKVGNKEDAVVQGKLLEELKNSLSPAALKALKESCEELCEQDEPKCQSEDKDDKKAEPGDARDEPSCANHCALGLSEFFVASETPNCLQELQELFACSFGQECKELDLSMEQLAGLMSTQLKAENMAGACKMQLMKVSEHCAADFKKFVDQGGPFPGGDKPIGPNQPFPGGDGPMNPDIPFPGGDKPIDPTEPTEPKPDEGAPTKPEKPPLGFRAMIGSEPLKGAHALAWANEKGVYSFAISNSPKLNCESRAGAYQRGITVVSEVTSQEGRSATVHFYHLGKRYIAKNSWVLVHKPKAETIELGITAKMMDGKFWASGALQAKICK